MALVSKYVQPLLAKGADTLVLGCTHYGFLSPLIQRIAGSDVRIVDTRDAVAKEVCRRLHREGLVCTRQRSGQEQFWSSDNSGSAHPLFSRLWGKAVTVASL